MAKKNGNSAHEDRHPGVKPLQACHYTFAVLIAQLVFGNDRHVACGMQF